MIAYHRIQDDDQENERESFWERFREWATWVGLGMVIGFGAKALGWW